VTVILNADETDILDSYRIDDMTATMNGFPENPCATMLSVLLVPLV